jgi:hypothetical protein
MPSRKFTRSIVVGGAAIAVAGGSYGIVTATSGSSPAPAGSGSAAAGGGSFHAGGGGSHARSGPAAGGASGTVGSVSASGFTTAAQVIVHPASSGTAASAAARVVPFQRGAPAASKQVGQIPANYREGSGTIVSGTAAALSQFPQVGGVMGLLLQTINSTWGLCACRGGQLTPM